MDHKEQHHQKRKMEREHEKKEHKKHEQQEKNFLPFHPAWLVAIGAVLVLAAVLIWTLLWP
jgi:hypothetical protein